MNTSVMFNVTSLNELFHSCHTVNLIDCYPVEAAKFLSDRYSGITVTGSEMTQELLRAIAERTLDAFHEKYCETPFLVIIFDKEDACKSTLQHEMVYIMSVRGYKKLKTVVLTAERIITYHLSNESFKGYTRLYTTIRD